jgi:hypothetical protein
MNRAMQRNNCDVVDVKMGKKTVYNQYSHCVHKSSFEKYNPNFYTIVPIMAFIVPLLGGNNWLKKNTCKEKLCHSHH